MTVAEIQVVGIPKGPVVAVQCSVCGPVAEVPSRLAPLRMLAHYHAHETQER